MTLIKWRKEFNLGVASVDHEHAELIALINELHEAAEAGCQYDDVLDALGEIFAQISAHFALEEKFMRDSEYAAYDEHKTDHERLLDQLRDIMDRVEDDGSYNKDRLSQELENWFTVHFRTHDARLHRAGH